jgi:phosphoribosyl 1,2-cyclic phosphodiesterase
MPDNNHKLSVCMLASGSRGNAVFVSDGTTSILIDAGLSGIEIERRLRSQNLCPENLDAIVVSHEHSDHIHGVGVLSRRFDLPVFINKQTCRAACSHIGKVKNIVNFESGTSFALNSLKIHPFSISHDAEDPVAFTINRNKTKIGIATDLGIATSMVKEHLKDCSLLVLEANHDKDMLINGPYPWELKQRIKNRTGHLSNEESKKLLMEVCNDRLQHVILAHMSETNNTPEKALSIIGPALANKNSRISVAAQNKSGAVIYLK